MKTQELIQAIIAETQKDGPCYVSLETRIWIGLHDLRTRSLSFSVNVYTERLGHIKGPTLESILEHLKNLPSEAASTKTFCEAVTCSSPEQVFPPTPVELSDIKDITTFEDNSVTLSDIETPEEDEEIL